MAPGTGFVEDNLSEDQGGGGGRVSVGFKCITFKLTCCGLVPYRPGLLPIHGQEVGDPCPR